MRRGLNMEKKIPKLIHYCWFGGAPLPDLAVKCINSWKKYCPDYKIIEWNEQNYDLNSCDYVKEAYAEKKWAFVSDYARFDILTKYGGIYFDTDVELIKSIDDVVMKGPFTGKEDIAGERVAPGLALAAYPHFPLFEEILDFYQKEHFKLETGNNTYTIVMYFTDLLKKYCYVPSNNIDFIQGMYIYPKKYFCPMDYYTGELTIESETKSIHHYTESWKNTREKMWHKMEVKLYKGIGEKKAQQFLNLKSVRLIYHIVCEGVVTTMKKLRMKKR